MTDVNVEILRSSMKDNPHFQKLVREETQRLTDEEAVKLLSDLLGIEVLITKQANTGRGPSKVSQREERQLIKSVFVTLTGHEPTEAQYEQIIP